ncbi:hypothetical protein KIN20_032572 [Parelaphostrongylus tenuis]|uniref:Uncharacterized protein n=1 Tax=Parelaphostrongylus tenuis TaxID=148309 RepID=A0AAD5R6Z4_PARTN|nr:hypothetical protein KIN20_032572 [Parelaphostrongylus tenuis]
MVQIEESTKLHSSTFLVNRTARIISPATETLPEENCEHQGFEKHSYVSAQGQRTTEGLFRFHKTEQAVYWLLEKAMALSGHGMKRGEAGRS